MGPQVFGNPHIHLYVPLFARRVQALGWTGSGVGGRNYRKSAERSQR